jgi:MFS family permease
MSARPTRFGEWRRGWTIVLGAAIGNATGLGLLFYVSSLFILPVSSEFGWSRAQLAAPAALSGLGAFAAPAFGWLADRMGVRPIAAFCALTLACCYLGLANLTGDYALFSFYVIVIGVVGLGTVGFIYSRPVAAWFERSRGLALGLAASGASITAVFAPPLLQALIDSHGWRTGYLALAFAAAGIGLPIVLALVRDRPGPSTTGRQGEAIQTAHYRHMIVRAAGHRAFWLLAVGLFTLNVAGSGALSQLAPLLKERGLTAQMAALGVTCYAIGLVIGRLGCGLMLDLLSPRLAALIFTGVPVLGTLFLLVPAPGLALALMAATMIGLQQGSEFDVIAYVVAHRFGVEAYAAIYGLIYVSGVIGTAIGAFGAGKIFDLTGGYTIALIASAVAFSIGCLTLAIASPAERTRERSSLHTDEDGANP